MMGNGIFILLPVSSIAFLRCFPVCHIAAMCIRMPRLQKYIASFVSSCIKKKINRI